MNKTFTGEKDKYNYYTCDKCGEVTVAFHKDNGTTPFMIGCNRTKNCDGFARSCMFNCSQENQIADIIFFRPKSRAEAKRLAKEEAEKNACLSMHKAIIDWHMNHYKNGGSFMRKV